SGTSLVFKLQSTVATPRTSEIEVLRRPVESTIAAPVRVEDSGSEGASVDPAWQASWAGLP
ncbi:hypothetical protein ACGFX8_37955, partial [Streptomyces sp. NPDC048362]|uniref:hypothetical protein n=1 Tax=Streptomyces sp. NPDC048362 TaxID=3365539 RepID=UPI00372205F8